MVLNRKTSALVNEPFSLGFPGEIWRNDLGCLIVPAPTDYDNVDGYVRAYKHNTKNGSEWYSATTLGRGWENFDDLLMLASYIQDYFDGLQEKAVVGATAGISEGS